LLSPLKQHDIYTNATGNPTNENNTQ